MYINRMLHVKNHFNLLHLFRSANLFMQITNVSFAIFFHRNNQTRNAFFQQGRVYVMNFRKAILKNKRIKFIILVPLFFKLLSTIYTHLSSKTQLAATVIKYVHRTLRKINVYGGVKVFEDIPCDSFIV